MSAYRRAVIRDHDTTTASGDVQARFNGLRLGDDYKNACYEGDPVACPACKSTGVTKCVPPYRVNSGHDGRQINLDGDLCICKCSPPPRLKARHHDTTVGFTPDEISKMVGSSGWMVYAGYSAAPQYDEKVHLDSGPVTLIGLPVFIELDDGRTLSGYSGHDGLLPRIETDNESFYHVYWGDEALAKMEGIEA